MQVEVVISWPYKAKHYQRKPVDEPTTQDPANTSQQPYTVTFVREITDAGWNGQANLYSVSPSATAANGETYEFVAVSAANILGIFDETAVFAVEEDGITPVDVVPLYAQDGLDIDTALSSYTDWLNSGQTDPVLDSALTSTEGSADDSSDSGKYTNHFAA